MAGFFWKLPLFRLFNSDVSSTQSVVNDDSDGESVDGDSRGFYDWFSTQLDMSGKRKINYKMYETMDQSDLSGSVLDLFSEDATQVDRDMKRVIWATGGDNVIVNAVNSMLKTTKSDEESRGIVRDIAKYGDNFERLVYATERGVLATHFAHPSKVARKEDKEKGVVGFVQDGKKFRGNAEGKNTKPISYPWDYVHFRLRGKWRDNPYGTSMLHNGRRPWKQLILSEDQALAYRLRRQGTRNVWMIDTGTQDPFEESQTLNSFRKRLRKMETVNSTEGKYNHQYNPMTPLQDIVMGMKKDSTTRVENLEGASNVNDMTDINYYVNKFFSAVRAPKGFFGFEGDINQKQTLSNQDVRYARSVRSLQHAYLQGMRTMAEIHLVLLDPNPESDKYNWRKAGKDFQLNMAVVSYLAELEMLELVQLRANVVSTFLDMGRDNPTFKAANWVMFILKDIAKIDSATINNVINTKTPPPEVESKLGDQMQSVQKELSNVDGKLSNEEKQQLSEAMQKNPDLTKSILLARKLYEPERPQESDKIFLFEGKKNNRSIFVAGKKRTKLPENVEDCFDSDDDIDNRISGD